MKKILSEFSFIVIIIGFSVISCKKYSEPDFSVVNNQIITQWENVSDSILVNSRIPGMIIGIWAPDHNLVWINGKGKANVITGERPSPAMKFQIASITKTFTYTVLLQLLDEGKLSLSDKLSKYLPGFPGSDNVTISMLCNHTSGVFDYSSSSAWLEAVQQNPLRKWFNMELVEYAAAEPYIFSPGSGFMYSNTNTLLAAQIVEVISGNSMADEIRQRILTPLHLSNTTYPNDQFMPPDYIHGYLWQSDTARFPTDVSEMYDVSLFGAAGAMASDVTDLKNWVEHLYKGTLLNPSTQAERLTVIPAPGEDCESYGLGIMFKTDPPMWGHTGTSFGYKNWMGYCPTLNLTMVICYNATTDRPMVLANRLMDVYLKSLNQ